MTPETLAYLQFSGLARYTEGEHGRRPAPRHTRRLPLLAALLRPLRELAGTNGSVSVPCPECT